MKPQQVKLAIAAGWMLVAAVAAAALGYLSSPSNVLMLVVVALAPSLAMWFWWSDPVPTLSESIQAARTNDSNKTTRS